MAWEQDSSRTLLTVSALNGDRAMDDRDDLTDGRARRLASGPCFSVEIGCLLSQWLLDD